MRTILVYLLVAVTCATIREANSSPGFLSDLFQHCPLLSYLFPNDCCCDTNTSCCTTTTSTTSTTTTTTTTSTTARSTAMSASTPPAGRRKRWVTLNYYNNLSSDIKYNATRKSKDT
ncbi:ELMO domain-containing protein C-like [Formica exsecta]|uniref:ELMO domain-containing protein C-like n=1 Tax=Formica exsecta TaxID=72781 RepID=UPI0011423E9E|nr:ELMO domain-containing protein C-like [Formica exsecta]